MGTFRQAVERQRERGVTISGETISIGSLQQRFQFSPAGSTRALMVKMLEGTTKSLPWAVILCRFKGSAPNPALEDPVAKFYREAFTPGSGGLVEYWRDASLGSIDIAGSRVFGWIEVDIPRDQAAAPGRSGLVDAAIRAVQSNMGDSLEGFYRQIAIYTHNWTKDDITRPPGTPYWKDGDPLKPWWPFWIDGSADGRGKVTLTPPHDGNITAHEMGHGFEMNHDVGPDLDADYSDPCCIMSQNNSFTHPTWKRAFGPALCLPHLMQRDWMYKRRVYYDDGGWLSQPDGITLSLAPISRLSARANLGIKLAYTHAEDAWDYYLEYVEPTAWNQGIGKSYLIVRRMAPKYGGTPAFLGLVEIPTTPGTRIEYVEPSGRVKFQVELTQLQGPILMVNARRL
jgi:hypothetical protein